jgi:predicted nucleic acid-binding protein
MPVAWELIRPDFGYYDIDRDVAERAARLRLELRRHSWQVSLIDGLTTVIALRNDLILLTTDQDFRAIPNLKQENWRI